MVERPCPARDSADTGTLTVSASGFPTGTLTVVHVLECEHGATDVSQCDANTDDPNHRANAAGVYTNNAYAYYALPNAVFGGLSSITCDATHDCDLVVIQDDYTNFSNPHVEIPISFSAVAASTTTVSTTTSPGAGPTTTTAPTGATTTVVSGTTVVGETTTAVTGTTAGAGTSTTGKGTATTLSGQGSGDTLPGDPSGGGSVDTSGGQLPFTGPPTAAPIVALCGLVILFAGTLMRRVVLRVPDTGVSIS